MPGWGVKSRPSGFFRTSATSLDPRLVDSDGERRVASPFSSTRADGGSRVSPVQSDFVPY